MLRPRGPLRPAHFRSDEATSSIDTETEQLIQNAIQTVLTGRTSFIVAHRLSTIRSADKILVIRGGRITEAGTHDGAGAGRILLQPVHPSVPRRSHTERLRGINRRGAPFGRRGHPSNRQRGNLK
ncbi:MAG: hypothetical protein ACLRZH_09615 [Ruthenibacterium lactatiformans]